MSTASGSALRSLPVIPPASLPIRANTGFQSDVRPTPAQIDEIEAAAPTNPFCTARYLAARLSLGETAVAFKVAEPDGERSRFYGFLKPHRFGSRLNIPSMPALTQPVDFAKSLKRFCAAQRVTELELSTYASPATRVPELPGEFWRFTRTEFIIDLHGDVFASMSKGHKSDVKRAQKAGLTLRRSVSEAACGEHSQLIAASMARRQSRGETVPDSVDVETLMAWLRSGAGELFQVVDGRTVFSSMLLLRARAGAYDHSAGSSPDGMANGAAKLLVLLACDVLRSEGSDVLNLGGVRAHEAGMRVFKENFGTRPVELDAACADLEPPIMRAARQATRFALAGLRRLRGAT